MKVSIIIPAYNAAETLASTLHSVLAQSQEEWEAIVVDDGSQDDTAKIAADFAQCDGRIRVVSQANGGEAAARNTGIGTARHDWLLFLDADDWIAPCYLQRMTTELMANPILDAVYCGSARVARDGALVVETYQPPPGDLFPILARRAAFPVHACVVRKSLVSAVGNFDCSLHTCPDWDLWQRVARTGARFGAVREVLAFYRMRPTSASMRAHQILADGLWVLTRGHAPDPRVRNPLPVHAKGAPPEGVRTQEYYLLSWCAGLLLGRGEDARALLETVRDHDYPDLSPEAVAQCIFDAGPLSSCQTSSGWGQLWPQHRHMIAAFLEALEQQSQAAGLAERASVRLKQLIRAHSKWLGAFVEDYESELAAKTQRIGELEQALAQQDSAVEHHESELAARTQRISELEEALAQRDSEQTRWRDEQAQRLAEERERGLADQQRMAAESETLRVRMVELERRLTTMEQDRSVWQEKAQQAEVAWRQLSGHWWVRLGQRLKGL